MFKSDLNVFKFIYMQFYKNIVPLNKDKNIDIDIIIIIISCVGTLIG